MNVHFFPANQKISAAQLASATRIGDEYRQIRASRMDFIARHAIDPAFALPSSNWAADSDNEFIKLFQRLSSPDPVDLSHFRGLTSVFSGYSLYHMTILRGLSIADLAFGKADDQRILARLAERNEAVINEWRRLTEGVPRQYLFSPPATLGEIGHLIDGVIVNDDTCNYQERINLLWRSGILDYLRDRLDAVGEIRICEIGGGYGALCHWFKQVFPAASYTIIDLPESLLFSNLYMALTRPDLRLSVGLEPAHAGVRFLANHMCESLDDSFDLVINTLSMSEMSALQVNRYIDLMMAKWLRDGGLFFEQNQDNRHMGFLFAQEVCAARFPYRQRLYDAETVAYRNGYPNVWSARSIDLDNSFAQGDTDGPVTMLEPPRLIESMAGCNIVAFTGRYFALSHARGAFDLGAATEDQRASIPSWPTLEAAREGVRPLDAPTGQPDAGLPRLVKAMADHNVVAYQGKFFTIPHDLGEVDLTGSSVRDMAGIRIWDTLEDASAARRRGRFARLQRRLRAWIGRRRARN